MRFSLALVFSLLSNKSHSIYGFSMQSPNTAKNLASKLREMSELCDDLVTHDPEPPSPTNRIITPNDGEHRESSLIQEANTENLYIANEATRYEVVVNNDNDFPINVYFFTSPAEFDGVSGKYTNSLGTKTVLQNSQAQFTYLVSYYAGAQKLTAPVGKFQEDLVASEQVTLKAASADKGDLVKLGFDENGDATLSSPPLSSTGVLDGAFEIQSPTFNINGPKYAIGLGCISGGVRQLASYIIAKPGEIVNVKPILKFYIAAGSVEQGMDADFISRSAESAVCDTTSGNRFFEVTRTVDGTWDIKSS